MATTLQTLIDRTRDFLRDTNDFDQLTTSLTGTAGTTTVSVADATIYRNRWAIEVDYETMIIRTAPSFGGSLTVTRGWRGSAITSHSSGAGVLVRPAFYAQEIITAVNTAIFTLYPLIYRAVVDTSLTVGTNQYQYVVPNMPGYTSYPIPMVYKVEVLQPGDYTFRGTRRWQIHRGDVTSGSPSLNGSVASTYPVFQFKSLPPIGGQVRVHGYGPFPPLTNLTDTLPSSFPPQAEYLLHRIAGAMLLQSGDAGRDRADTGAVDRREEANRGGLSMQTAMGVLSRTEQELLRNCMPPLTRHIQSAI